MRCLLGCLGIRVFRVGRVCVVVRGCIVLVVWVVRLLLAGHVRLRKGSIVTSVVLVGEYEVIDLSGEGVDEPVNRWGFPTAVVSRAGVEPVCSVKRFSEPEFGCQLPFAGDGVLYPLVVLFDCSVVDSVCEFAEFFGVWG